MNTNDKTLSNTQVGKMFDDLQGMFKFIMAKITRLEEKIDQQGSSLHTHINDEEGKLAEHSVILNIIVWLSASIAVAVIGFGVKYLFEH